MAGVKRGRERGNWAGESAWGALGRTPASKLSCRVGRGEERVTGPLKPSPEYTPKYYVTSGSKKFDKSAILTVYICIIYSWYLFSHMMLFNSIFDYLGEWFLLGILSIYHIFGSSFLSPTPSFAIFLWLIDIANQWQQSAYLRNFSSSLSQRVLSEPLPVLHDFYTCMWVLTNQRCLLPFMRECCESEAAFVFSRMLGKFVRKFEYCLLNLSFTTSRHSVASIP